MQLFPYSISFNFNASKLLLVSNNSTPFKYLALALKYYYC